MGRIITSCVHHPLLSVGPGCAPFSVQQITIPSNNNYNCLGRLLCSVAMFCYLRLPAMHPLFMFRHRSVADADCCFLKVYFSF